MLSPKATGDFEGEYFGLARLDRRLNWAGDVWRLEENDRSIPTFSIEVVPWQRVMTAPVRFWPPRRRLRVRDAAAKGEPTPLEGDEPRPLLAPGPGGGGGDPPGVGGGEEDDPDWLALVALMEAWDLEFKEDGGGCGGDGNPDEGGGGAEDDGGGDADVPPPPTPHPVPRKGPGQGGGGTKYLKYPIFDGHGFECGYFIINENARSLDMHCNHHAGDCSIGRSYVGYEGAGNMTAKRSSKGRCMAYLIAWCRIGHRFPDTAEGRAAHKEASHGRTEATEALQHGNSPIRLCSRDYAEETPSLAPVRAVERQPRDGEPFEPIGGF